jgi:hypothetical protein
MEMQQHYAPPDESEKANLDNLIELLHEIDNDGSGHHSLAAKVARVWASLLDDTWTWEGTSHSKSRKSVILAYMGAVTWRMGGVLRKLADVYEKDRKMSQILF